MNDGLHLEMAAVTRSSTATLRCLFDEIQKQVRLGYSHKEICAQLNSQGLEISYPYYRVIMTRLRSERAACQRGADPSGATRTRDDKSSLRTVVTTSENENATAIAAVKVDVLDSIRMDPPKAKPFSWSGREMLEKNWDNF